MTLKTEHPAMLHKNGMKSNSLFGALYPLKLSACDGEHWVSGRTEMELSFLLTASDRGHFKPSIHKEDMYHAIGSF